MTNIAVRQSGRLVAASQALDDTIWRYGFPETKPRSDSPGRTPAVTTAELQVLDRADLSGELDRGPARAVEPPPIPGARPDGRSDTMPNIPQVSAARTDKLDIPIAADTGRAYAEAMAEMITADNEDALAATMEIPEASDEDRP